MAGIYKLYDVFFFFNPITFVRNLLVYSTVPYSNTSMYMIVMSVIIEQYHNTL